MRVKVLYFKDGRVSYGARDCRVLRALQIWNGEGVFFHFLVVVVAGETEDQQVVVVAAVPLPVRAAAAVVLVAAAAPALPGGVAQVRQGSGLHAHLIVIFLCPVTSLF